VPGGWTYLSSDPAGLQASQAGSAIVLAEAQGTIKLRFAPHGAAADSDKLAH
jgi:hypothetical protein